MICGLLGGVAIPIICFVSAFAHGSLNVPDAWQSGQPDQYAVLMTKWPNVWPFYPFLAYCMVCCGLVLVGGQRWIDRLGVRFGIYTGVPLAIQYHMLVFPPRDWNPFSILPSLLSLAIGIPVTFVLLGILLVAGSLLRQVFGSRERDRQQG